MNYTADYTQDANGRWTARLRPDDAPDDYIETRAHGDFAAAAGEVFDLLPDGATVALGAVTGDV